MGICLHKAKRKDNGEWVEGYLYRLSEQHPPFIMLSSKYGESHEVDEETICRCMGLPCRNAEKTWEHDIVRTEFDDGEYICVIEYNEEKACFMNVVPCERNYPYNIDIEELKNYDVLGNRFDNPELLDVVTELVDGEYEVRREIDYRNDKGERIRIAYHTGITIDGDKAWAANSVRLDKNDLIPVMLNLKKIR